jgi:5,10-methylenetetrahydromethanopterin reductase
MTVGVISHLHNPTTEDAVALAVACERAGADWLGLPDAFWWRDVWVQLTAAAQATRSLRLGPVVTNPYLRHPFHTVAAVATLQGIGGDRFFLGLAAGGSEVTGAARISRHDAGTRIDELAHLVRSVAAGAPLDEVSGRRLEVPLAPVPILVAGRGDGVLRAAGRSSDDALVWAVPMSDLERSVGVIERAAAASRSAPGARPRIIWAPLVVHDDMSAARIATIAAYSVLNSSRALHQRWGLDASALAEIRALLVASGAAAARHLVPDAALHDLIVTDSAAPSVAAVVRRIGATAIAVPAFDIASVPDRVAWARSVLAAL